MTWTWARVASAEVWKADQMWDNILKAETRDVA